ncbi:TonB-dependent receptor domain-containing protein [Brevundimonas sp.]|uniref:TonB-dependent receptor domain-containing protein n=1 Tax=Brevundimonas sp. TaxID=1871086 RepID=UPI00286B1DB2|nr:TonB-dependent receptor [Brevundimonas sp.]
MLSTRKYLVGTTVLAGVLTLSAPAFAQSTAPAQDDETQVDEVVVTGSRIRRDPTTSPTPLIQIKREELLATGQATLIDYLAQIPALSNSQIPTDNVGGVLNAQGLNIANLRALGNNRTLTLIDGRRQVGSVGGSLAVSVNTIPRLLIENIEIITGGASSVYGADAVAGVINFTLRKDFEGLELDLYGNQLSRYGDNYGRRASLLVGKNFFDDRLNLYGFAEYEKLDAVGTLDLGFLADGCALVGVDSDPTAAAAGLPIDDQFDNRVFCGVNTISRPRGGQTTIANSQQPSALNNPLVGVTNCTAFTQATCYSVDPTKTWVFPQGGAARLANFGQRIGNVGASRTLNIGGDGENPAFFNQADRTGSVEAQRYQTGANFQITDSISGLLEAKYITETTFATAQPTFFDWYLNDAAYAANESNGRTGISPSNQNQVLRVSDNAFLPAALRAAILGNTVANYTNPTVSAPGTTTAAIAAPWARHVSFAEDRSQDNTRELQRYVAALSGQHGDVGPVRNLNWDLAYSFSKLENANEEIAVDTQRYVLGADAVVDTAGIVNGRPGEIVCRVQILAKTNAAMTNATTGLGGIRDWSTQAGQTAGTFGDLRARAEGRAAIAACKPINVFGQNAADPAALAVTYASVTVRQTNEQENLVGSVSGQLWDFWGAGSIGVAVGGEYRRESTEGVGRSRDTGDRQLFLNTSPDQPYVEYETKEAFAEISLPLFRDTWLGQYAELSGSYRYSDYTTVGQTDVYGVNLVYRPISDFAIKSSYNTSVRVPTLSENFSPQSQTFANNFADPCTTAAITNSTLAADIRANRIANCTALAAAKGLTYDFGGTTLDPNDDYAPIYSSGVAGVNGGNPFLTPEESTSFTFSTVWTPSYVPNFSFVLDYYEIEIDQVIAAVTAQTAAANCVSGPGLNSGACATIFRRVAPVTGTSAADRSEAFKVGAPAGDAIGGFIQGSINYAKRTVRGLDFTANYSLDTEEVFGRNFGTFRTSLQGSWLIEQKQFNNIDNPADFTEFSSTLQTGGSFPRLRFSNTLVWSPNDLVDLTWVVDWQTAQDIVQARDLVNNIDSRPIDYYNTGNFTRHDFGARFNVREDLTLRVGLSNAFDARQRDILGATLYSNFDPYGRRFNVSLNYRPW